LNSAIRIGVLTEENLDLAWLSPNLFRQAQFILITHLTAENTAKLQEKGFQVFPGQ
jgi:glycerophosphoryl diester phosphodiesterase